MRPSRKQGVVDYMKKTMPDEYHDALIPKYRKAMSIFTRACPDRSGRADDFPVQRCTASAWLTTAAGSPR